MDALGRVLQDAVELVARTLDVEHVTILELAPEGPDVRLRAGVGWEQGAIGHTVGAMPGGYVAYTLAATEPVIVADLAAEDRFAPSPILLGAGIRSSLAVRIPGTRERSYGVIGAHATSPRRFTAEDVRFLGGIAAMVSAAIARHRQALQINDEVLQTLLLAHYAAARGEPAEGLLEVAIGRTRALISDMLGEGTTLPGDLRRGAAADVSAR